MERRGKSKGREGKGKGERFKPESLYLPLVALPLVSMFLCGSLHLPRSGELAYRLLNQQLITRLSSLATKWRACSQAS